MFVRPSFDAVIDQISRTFGEPVDQLRARSHRASRKALAQLAWQESGLTLAAIANWMNVTDRAVSHLVKCGKSLEESDRLYRDRVRRRCQEKALDGSIANRYNASHG